MRLELKEDPQRVVHSESEIMGMLGTPWRAAGRAQLPGNVGYFWIHISHYDRILWRHHSASLQLTLLHCSLELTAGASPTSDGAVALGVVGISSERGGADVGARGIRGKAHHGEVIGGEAGAHAVVGVL